MRRLALLIVMLWALAVPAASVARPLAAAQTCHANGTLREDAVALARGGGARWNCAPTNYAGGVEAQFVRMRLDPRTPLPRAIVTHQAAFDAMTVWAIDRDASWRSLRRDSDQVEHLTSGPFIALPVPRVDPRTEYLVVRIDRPAAKVLASETRLDSEPGGSGWDLSTMVAMAMICGMLVVPLMLNGVLYIALQRSYVLWHVVLIASMLMQAAIGTSIAHLLFTFTVLQESMISNFCFGLMGSAGLMFAVTFTEPECQGRLVRRLVQASALLVFAISCIVVLPLPALRPWSALAIYCDMGFAIATITVAIADAWRRGSRLVWFQIAGWGPAMLVGVWRIGSYLLPGSRPVESVVLFQLGLAVEVLASSAGIISRFIDLRRERDDARARAAALEGVAQRDALTGLWNRHAVESRFDDLFRKGFRTMAVIDLDHFKQVNDRHGHAVGDQVLRAAALALADDADTRAIRMGGEEFLLLLRGNQAGERAERYRRAISTRIAAEVPGLDRMVTASMGLVEHDRVGRLEVAFEVLYARCDSLLYEAKRLGRNRTMRERVTSFGEMPAAPLASAG